MADCCGTSPSASASRCPASGTQGKPVDIQTVKALLRESALGRLSLSSHQFCPAAECDVVYFDDGGAVYRRDDIRVPVWEKEPVGARMLCYCFGETEAAIRAELDRSGRSDAVTRIRGHIAAGRCACEVRNPRGVCCLGDVTAAVSRIRALLARSAHDMP